MNIGKEKLFLYRIFKDIHDKYQTLSLIKCSIIKVNKYLYHISEIYNSQ